MIAMRAASRVGVPATRLVFSRLKSTAPRFLKVAASEAPGPGKYTPRHTLQDSRGEIPEMR